MALTINSILLAGVMILIAGAVHAAGFDCAKAKSLDEMIICSDTRLSHLDDILTEVYAASKPGKAENPDNMRSARNFMADRRDCRGDYSCILSAYLAVLWNLSGNKYYYLQGLSAKDLVNGRELKSGPVPTTVGRCVATTVDTVTPRFYDGQIKNEDWDSGTVIGFTNNGGQQSYGREEPLIRSKPRDEVVMCLVEIDRDCAPDSMGRLYLVTNQHTHETWVQSDSLKQCGGDLPIHPKPE